MARYDKTPKDDGGRLDVQVINIHLEGSNATLQAGLRDLEVALTRASNGGARTLPAKAVNALPQGAAPEQAAEDGVQEAQAAPAAEPAASQPARPKGPRRYPTPKVLDSLDLTSGPVPLKDFVKQKGNPVKDSETYLLVAAWLKQNRQIHAVTADEIFTCFRMLGRNAPDDITGPIRAMKKQGWFKNGPKSGSYEITNIGLEKVAEMGAGQPT